MSLLNHFNLSGLNQHTLTFLQNNQHLLNSAPHTLVGIVGRIDGGERSMEGVVVYHEVLGSHLAITFGELEGMLTDALERYQEGSGDSPFAFTNVLLSDYTSPDAEQTPLISNFTHIVHYNLDYSQYDIDYQACANGKELPNFARTSAFFNVAVILSGAVQATFVDNFLQGIEEHTLELLAPVAYSARLRKNGAIVVENLIGYLIRHTVSGAQMLVTRKDIELVHRQLMHNLQKSRVKLFTNVDFSFRLTADGVIQFRLDKVMHIYNLGTILSASGVFQNNNGDIVNLGEQAQQRFAYALANHAASSKFTQDAQNLGLYN